MAMRGSVKDSSFTSPRKPRAPATLPRMMRRPCSFMMRLPPRGWRGEQSGCVAGRSGGVGLLGLVGGRSGGGLLGGRSGSRGLLVVLVQRSDLVAHLRTVAQPVLDALVIEDDAGLATGRDRVVEAQAFDVAAVTGTAAVGDDDVVEGALLGATACQSDLDHGVFLCCPAAGMTG